MTIAYVANMRAYDNVDYGRAFTMRSDATTVIDITGDTFRLVIANSADVILKTLEIGTGITVTDAPNGAWRFDLTVLELAALGVGRFKHELRWTQGATSQILWTGRLTVVNGLGAP